MSISELLGTMAYTKKMQDFLFQADYFRLPEDVPTDGYQAYSQMGKVRWCITIYILSLLEATMLAVLKHIIYYFLFSGTMKCLMLMLTSLPILAKLTLLPW